MTRLWLPRDLAEHTPITYPVPEDRLDLVRRVLAPAGNRRSAMQLVLSHRGLAALPA